MSGMVVCRVRQGVSTTLTSSLPEWRLGLCAGPETVAPTVAAWAAGAAVGWL